MTESIPHRYRAFISYSKLDQQHAKRLHSALETYRVPKGIDATLPRDRRLGRFFRDDDEMGASTDLGATLREALDNSENLILICSPHSARSKWVNAEIVHFKNLGRRILAVIVDGIPNSNDPESNCFPPALASAPVAEELLSERHTEPLGIDLRKESFQRARIRLVAGLLGISFDSLWQRERRRKMKRRAVAAVATVVLASVIGLLGVKWLMERNRVKAQRIDSTLVKVRNDLASERVSAGLSELETLTAEGERNAVEDVLKSTLAWVSTPTELFKELKPPIFVTNGSQLLFIASDGSQHPVNSNQPYRRILTSDKRHLLVITDEESLILNVADGRELARIATNGMRWDGHVFQTGSGLLVIGGRYFGLTTGSMRSGFLVFSPKEQTLSLFNANLVHQLFDSVAVSRDCRNFGIRDSNAAPVDETATTPPTDMFFFSADNGSLKAATAPESIADWQSVTLFSDSQDDLNLTADGAGGFKRAGCVEPTSDSASPTAQPGATGLFRPVGLGTFWEPERRWKVIKEIAEETDGGPGGDSTTCSEEHPCRIQNPTSDSQDDGILTGWDTPLNSRPRGVHRDDRSFASVNNEAVYFGYTQYNSGVRAAWCRNLNAKVTCFVSLDTFEIEDEETLDLRSNTGRLIFNPRGLRHGFQLYDLSTMRDVSPKGTEIVAGPQQAEFSLNDERLFVAFNGRLLVFTPPSDGGNWQLVKDPASIPIPALSGNKDDKVTALLALDDKDLVVVSSSGVISRFDWRTGQQSWTRTISSVGEVSRAVVSKNRRYLFVIGKGGGRLLDTTDGLVLSGTLVPPNAMSGRVEMSECFKQAFVADTGTIELTCGDKEYRREPVTFSGDARSRLREILADGSGSK